MATFLQAYHLIQKRYLRIDFSYVGPLLVEGLGIAITKRHRDKRKPYKKSKR